jgi:hypothetical protein
MSTKFHCVTNQKILLVMVNDYLKLRASILDSLLSRAHSIGGKRTSFHITLNTSINSIEYSPSNNHSAGDKIACFMEPEELVYLFLPESNDFNPYPNFIFLYLLYYYSSILA